MSDMLLANLWRAIQIGKPAVIEKLREARSLEELEPWQAIHSALEDIEAEKLELEKAGCL